MVKKSGTSIENPNEFDFIWGNSTPYNNQSSRTWSLDNSLGYTEVDRTLENDIHLPATPLKTLEYFTDIWNTGYQSYCIGYDQIWGQSGYFSYEEMFFACPPIPVSQISPYITKPSEEPSFWPYYLGHRPHNSTTWITDVGLGTSASYKQMNKYYNCVFTWIDFYKRFRMSATSPLNYYKEPISFDLYIYNYLTYDLTNEYFAINGKMKITYAVRKSRIAGYYPTDLIKL
jgi:hypothetical protein